MKKKLSAYWWCQIGGWSIFIVLSVLNIDSYEPNSIWNFVLLYFLIALLGIFVSHLMRLFIVKARIFQSSIFRQLIYMLLTTLFFAFIYALLIVTCGEILHWRERFAQFSNKWNITLVLFIVTNCLYFGIWNAIYFVYHHMQKSQKEQIEKIRLENELQIQKLESEKQQTNQTIRPR